MKHLVVNADDLGYTEGINRAIADCHARGIVTSASLMVTGHAVEHALELTAAHPGLGIGLHWDVWGEDEREFDISDPVAVRSEFERQVECFHALVGQAPTHVDSHRHAHLEPEARDVILDAAAPLGVPVRGDGRVRFVGGFYAQWEWRVTDLRHVSVDALRRILREEVLDGWTEVSCHPGYVRPEDRWVYASEREEEVRTLTDPRVRDAVAELGIRLETYAGVPPAEVRPSA